LARKISYYTIDPPRHFDKGATDRRMSVVRLPRKDRQGTRQLEADRAAHDVINYQEPPRTQPTALERRHALLDHVVAQCVSLGRRNTTGEFNFGGEGGVTVRGRTFRFPKRYVVTVKTSDQMLMDLIAIRLRSRGLRLKIKDNLLTIVPNK
jgi:hypothetical protein